MRKLDNSLVQCFSRPTVAFAVLVLLLNDFYLKQNYSNWLTGKLSDFAGLFFFPILLFTFAAKFFPYRQSLAAACFALTFVVFLGLKTIPIAAETVSYCLSQILGATCRVVPDPTDAVALVMLLPSWILLSTDGELPRAGKSSPAGPVFVAALAVFACVATSVEDPRHFVRMLIVQQDQVYAVVTEGSYAKPTIYHCTDDELREWERIVDPPFPFDFVEWDSKRQRQVADNSGHRYRLVWDDDLEDVIERSTDESEWELVWRFPQSMPVDPGADTCDLVVLPDRYADQGAIAVSLGTKGILVGRDEEWSFRTVGKAGPNQPLENPNGKRFGRFLLTATIVFFIFLTIFAFVWAWAIARIVTRVSHWLTSRNRSA